MQAFGRDSENAGQTEEAPAASRGTAFRAVAGGLLMGLANLVPGISGGTMLLAAGIYPRFVEAIAEITTLKFRFRSIFVLGLVVVSAVLGVVLFAGPIKDLVVEHRWVMYSIFIGLTLGGLPIVWRMARPVSAPVWVGAALGFAVMVLLALAQSRGTGAAGAGEGSVVFHGLAGLAGASAMILPGISGGYLLLLLGEYIPILSAIDAFKEALKAGDLGAAMGPGVNVLLPVAIGVVIGVIGVSNLLRWLLASHRAVTLGALIGLLAGAVVGLWPFQRSVEPVLGETIIKGQVVTTENLSEFDVEDYPTERFSPRIGQVLGALGLVLAGFGVTLGIARLGAEEGDGKAL